LNLGGLGEERKRGMICPYCDIEISENAVEAEDGCCPECGATLTMSSLFADPDDFEDDFEEEFDDLDDEEFI
jgi:hypothetical protein